MNPFMKMQITQMVITVRSFEKALEFSAMKDDGRIDGDEAKTIKKLSKASESFIKELEAIERK